MYTLSINMWFQKLIKQFFFGIDQIVYNFISEVYDLLISIARTSILSQADILDMADRIYKLLAVFMIFKVTFSLITYVVNPDDFSDKSKGVAKLGTNIIIALALLILTPYVFNYAYKLQTIILEDNTLATLIFGNDDKDSASNFLNTAGDDMAYITMSAFFTPNVSINELNCINIVGEDGNFNKKCSGLDENYNDAGLPDSLAALTEDDENSGFRLKTLQNYVAGVEHQNLGLMFRQEMAVATAPGNETFIMDYKYIFSTVVGVVIILLLITFCMDVAVRSIKLAFLQLIAPIPIISYVDPKSGKDGLFKKWYQMCFKTYLSLFIRILAIYFAVYIIGKLNNMVDIVDGSYVTNIYIKIFIIIGVLMFAKQLPKILEGLGIKLDGGGFALNPLKKLEKDAIGGKQILGGAGAVGAIGAATLASTAGAIGNIKSRWGSAQGFKAKAGLIAGGLTSGLSSGFRAGAKGIGSAFKGEGLAKSFTNSYKQAMSGEKSRMDRLADGVGFFEVQGAKIQKGLGIRTKGENVKIAADAYKDSNEKYSAAKNNILAVDAIAKNLNEQLKVVEASTIDMNSYYAQDAAGNITFDQNKYDAAVEGLTKKKKALNDAIDKRVEDLMTGGTVYMKGDVSVDYDADGKFVRYIASNLADANTTSTEYVHKLNKELVLSTEMANAVATSVDSEFGGATADETKPKATAKSSQTASSAIPTTQKARHASDVDKYTNGKSNK